MSYHEKVAGVGGKILVAREYAAALGLCKVLCADNVVLVISDGQGTGEVSLGDEHEVLILLREMAITRLQRAATEVKHDISRDRDPDDS